MPIPRNAFVVSVLAALSLLIGACSGGGDGLDILAEGERNPDIQPTVSATAEISKSGDVVVAEPTATPGPTSADAPTPSTPPFTPTPRPSPTPLEAPTAIPKPTVPPSPTPDPTATPLPAFPEVSIDQEITATIGQPVAVEVSSTSSAANAVESATFDPLVPGLDGTNRFDPVEAGTWESALVVTDSFGRVERVPVTFKARFPANPDAVVAMGDSVASGHGLDVRDYLGRDPCFRSSDGYPAKVRDGLVQSGELPQTAPLALVACSGASASDLTTEPVSGGLTSTGPNGADTATQLDWAVRANPGIVLITVGINNIGFVNPDRLIQDGGLRLDLVQPRLAELEADLSSIVDTLLANTDARIAVTGYYNPTAARPQGIDGCDSECFAAVTASAVAFLNTAIANAADGDDRVVFVDVAPAFVGHGAPNGYGPDGARAGAGLFGNVLGSYTRAIQPYCSKGDSAETPWVNAVDCVHPTETGAQAIATEVVAALAGIGV